MSNPYGAQAPFPQHAPQHPAPPQQYPVTGQGQAWNQPGLPPFGAVVQGGPPYGVPPRQRNGLAVTAIAISVVALLASLGVVVFIALGSFAGGSGVLTGQVEPSGGAVAGDVLHSALIRVIEEDGGYVGEIDCPDSSAVGQGLLTVCHGSVDDFDWTGIVVFEDDSGTFTLNEL